MNSKLLQANALMKSSVCFYLLLDDQAHIAIANDLFVNTFNQQHQLLPFVHLSDQSQLLSALQPAINHTPTSISLRLHTTSGEILNTRWDVQSLQQDERICFECVGVVSVQTNGTNKINGEVPVSVQKAHSAQEEQYKMVFYNNPLPMWIYEVKTLRFIEVNDAAIRQYGYTRTEFLQLTVKDIRPEDEQYRFSLHQQTPVADQPIYKGFWLHKKKNGSIIHVQITAHLISFKGITSKLVLAEDITDKTRAEENLLESNKRYNFAIKATFDAIWDWDFKTDHLYYGEGFKMLFGYDVPDNQGDLQSWLQHIHTDERDRVKIGLDRAISTGATNWTDEYKYTKADGTFAYVVHRGIIVKDEQGNGQRMIGAMQDATSRKVNEQQLQKINLQLMRQQKERELTASILRSLSENELLNDALEDILRKLTLFFHFEIGEIWFLNIDRNRLEMRQKWYASKEMAEFYALHPNITFKMRDDNSLGKSWKENEIIFIDDLEHYESFMRKAGAAKTGLTNSLGVPVIFKGQTIAVFSFFGNRDFSDREKVKLYFESLSLQLGIDIQRKKTEEELNKFFQLSPDILTIIGFDKTFKKVNTAFSKILGYTQRELTALNFEQLVAPDDLEFTREQFKKLELGDTVEYFENRFRTRDGAYRWLAWASAPLSAERVIYATAKDITEKKLLNEKVDRILESISDGFFTVDKDSLILYWNQRAEKLLNLKKEDVLGKNVFDIFRNVVSKRFFSEYKRAFERNEPAHFEEFIPKYNTWFDVSAYPNEGILSVFFKDVTARKQTEETIRVSGERYEVLAKATKDTIWDWNLLTSEIVWNEGISTSFGYSAINDTTDVDWWLDKLHPEDRSRVNAHVNQHINEHRTHYEDEYRFCCADGSYKYIYDRGFTIYDGDNKPVRMIGSMQDLTETKANEVKLKDLNESLEIRASQLATSNAELERFAYVASHDLQEPLRMVSSFLQLIEKRYKDKLDKKAHEYIAFAVDGADRMKGLILDLLEYSRVNSRKELKEEVDLNEVAANLLLTYKDAIAQEKGSIIFERLPVVTGVKLQLLQLFQNLISNALKYKSTRPPHVRVTCTSHNQYFQFAVSDNGIGIEERFFNKIFVIFQRLHNKNEYSGTGIGLAICKKIVDLHEGQIWLESKPGEGSTFFFTLPKVAVNM